MKVCLKSAEMSVMFGMDSGYMTTVTGKMRKSWQLESLRLNSDKTFTLKEMLSVFRNIKSCIEPKMYNHISEAVKSFTAKRTQTLTDKNDKRGNKESSRAQSVEAEMIESFEITMPFYENELTERTTVSVFYDATDAGIFFWFECDDLPSTMEQIATDRINDLLTKVPKEYFTIYV